MARSPSATTIFQEQQRAAGEHLVGATQIEGIYYGTVTLTDQPVGTGLNSPLPAGMMQVNIPDLGVNYVSTPVPYPGTSAPPIGTNVSVGFDSRGNPVILAIYGYQAFSNNNSNAFFLGG